MKTITVQLNLEREEVRNRFFKVVQRAFRNNINSMATTMMDGPSITENAKQFDGKRETVNAQQEKVCTKSKNGCSKLPEPFKGYVETFVAGLYINTFMYLPFIFWFLNGILFVSEKKCDCSPLKLRF